MTELVLTNEEARQVKSSHDPVVVKGPEGEVLGFFLPPRVPDEFDQIMIERIKANRQKPRVYHTYEQVKDRLHQLETGKCAGK